mmetsp:Transcript_123378/g.349528  ORF Transcript_123378/g.349528 Transcript_123378/m.349528 type:complete len:161 (+) Transcript_123378:71-553(+)|eukprot:CAMPEP_0179245486 /NCGR_PEP_ID=MMETSP0797-20121207/18599_1 /TAXON_ID=47934 /ORGANISM="Dinophysis acuminata, Strain DAEP01" /LENGTH=160 /DNA_ID=CAMNT_0020953037 /DNA_START=71 /DNA_END=553 /DNA_ORIENTATION=-
MDDLLSQGEQLTPEQIENLKDGFALFDKDADGVITIRELGTLMRSLGQNPGEAELETMVNEVDADGSGTIDFPEFLSLMAIRGRTNASEEDVLMDAFKSFDKDEVGFITEENFISVMTTFGEKMSPEEVGEVIDQIKFMRNVYKNGDIDYAAFTQLLTTK